MCEQDRKPSDIRGEEGNELADDNQKMVSQDDDIDIKTIILTWLPCR